MMKALVEEPDSEQQNSGVILNVRGIKVFLKCSAIPEAASVSAARELVGQPFLRDHELSDILSLTGTGPYGPVHVVGCFKGVTENQVAKILGTPDAILVSPPFGVFVADTVQKIQMAFLQDCRDESTTRHNIRQFLTWLEQTGEREELLGRAKSRTKIVKTIAEEYQKNVD